VVGTDASSQMLRYAEVLRTMTDGVNFQQWDAGTDESTLQDRSFDRAFAKLVLNYVSRESLQENVLPRLRECLKDDGLLLVVLPNPHREASYSRANNKAMNAINVNVGNFSADALTQTYHHTYETMIQAANYAGFAYGNVLGLPEVRFEPYKRRLMKIAHPMPITHQILNAKRWIYLFGATEASAENFDEYPEIADIASMPSTGPTDPDIDFPVAVPHDTIYSYRDTSDSHNNGLLTVEGSHAEHMTPKQKIKLAKLLAARGLRGAVTVDDFLVTV
jgi:SAM-dependent methyltransferase